MTTTAGVMNRGDRRAWRIHVLGCRELTHAEARVLLALEEFADYRDGTNARPGEQTLADLCGVTRRVVTNALASARRLRLIEQTKRANPKRHLAATYRLVSMSRSVLIEDVSMSSSVRTESGFNAQKSGFNEKPDGVSMRSTLLTSIPLVPLHQPQESAARANDPDARLPADQDAHTPPANAISKEANNIDDDEPPMYCPKHMPFGLDKDGRSPRCDECFRLRIAREQWHNQRIFGDAREQAARAKRIAQMMGVADA